VNPTKTKPFVISFSLNTSSHACNRLFIVSRMRNLGDCDFSSSYLKFDKLCYKSSNFVFAMHDHRYVYFAINVNIIV